VRFRTEFLHVTGSWSLRGIRFIGVIRGRLLLLNSCPFVVKTKVRFGGARGGDGSQSRGYRKQKRPAFAAGRFELIQLNEPGSLIMNRSRGGYCARGIARVDSSGVIPNLLADCTLELCITGPTGSCSLTLPIDRRVPAFLYRNEPSRTVRRVGPSERGVVSVVVAFGKNRSRRIRVLDRPNFKGGCPATVGYRIDTIVGSYRSGV